MRESFFFYLFLFLIISTWHLESAFLSSLHLELVALLLVFIFHFKKTFLSDKDFVKASLLALGLITVPLLSSLANHDYLQVFARDDYKSYLKILLFVPLMVGHFKDEAGRDRLMKFIILSFLLLGLLFLYHYLILGEVREFDERPLLKTRHGDPNFMCLFFSSVIPLLFMVKIRPLWRYSATFFFIGLCLMTQSRMGLLGLALVGMVSLVLFTPKERLPARIGGVLLLGGAGIGLFLLFQHNEWVRQVEARFTHLGDDSNRKRVMTYLAGLNMFLQNPFWGVGWKRAAHYFYENSHFYPLFQSDDTPLEVHDSPLAVLCELGIVGLACFSLLIGEICRRIGQNWGHPHAKHSLLLFLILFINALTIHAFYVDLMLLQLFLLLTLNQGRARCL